MPVSLLLLLTLVLAIIFLIVGVVKKNKLLIIASTTLFLISIAIIAAIIYTVATENTATTQVANPASVNCIEKGGKLSIIDKPEGQVGMCTLSDGTICEEWAYFRGECTTSSPVPGTEKAVQAFLANKHKKPLSEVKVTIQKEAPGYAAGSVLFGQGGPGEGGMWLAVAGNQWDVVWDGNGAVDCNKMRQEYGFPDTILKPNFCD